MPERQPPDTVITLANATRPRRPAGARIPTAVNPFDSFASAAALLEPLGLAQPLRPDELSELDELANEVRAITDALVDNRRPPGIGIVNRLSAQASATQTLRIGADGRLSADIQWQADSMVAELACRVVAEIGQLDTARLRYCAREACNLLFYDTTRGSTQRWHSQSPCGLRERQDRWRKAATKPASV